MIKVINVSKTYAVWSTPLSRLLLPVMYRTLRHIFPNWFEKLRSSRCQYVHALENVDFQIDSGDSLGIIGLNGSGKSTLLQIIAGTLQPTSGHVEITGRVAALLELGSGFDPEFTGKENVYLNASILGLTRQETDQRYQAIVEFADIGEFIDRPVKTYSSGMMVRLAFAVQVHVDPEVLIVDEALSVGDARFQAKALNKIDEILQKGTTLLFVGHDLNAVRSFCRTVILLDKGKIIGRGDPEEVITDYIYFVQKDRVQSAGIKASMVKHGDGFFATELSVRKAAFGNGDSHMPLGFGDVAHLKIDVDVATDIESPFIIIDVVDAKGLQLTGKRIPMPKAIGCHRLQLQFGAVFQHGLYRIRIRLASAPAINRTAVIAKYDDLLSFDMVEDVRDQFTGIFPVPMEIDWITHGVEG